MITVAGMFSLSFVALSIVLAWIAINYAMGYYLNQPRMIALAKHEFIQWILSVIILVGMMGIGPFLMMFLTQMGFTDPIKYVVTYLLSLEKDIQYSYVNLHKVFYVIRWAAGGTYGVGSGQGPGVTTSIIPVAGVLLDAVGILDFLLFFFMTALRMQIIIISLLPSITFDILFPLAALLRIFPFTRRASGMLFGFIVAIYVAFPLLFAFIVKGTTEVMADSPIIQQIFWEGMHPTLKSVLSALCHMFDEMWPGGTLNGKVVCALTSGISGLTDMGTYMLINTIGRNAGSSLAYFIFSSALFMKLPIIFTAYTIMIIVYVARVYAEGMVIFSLVSLLFPTVGRAVMTYIERVFV